MWALAKAKARAKQATRKATTIRSNEKKKKPGQANKKSLAAAIVILNEEALEYVDATRECNSSDLAEFRHWKSERCKWLCRGKSVPRPEQATR